MDGIGSLTGQRRISLITRHADGELQRIQELVTPALHVDGQAAFERVLEQLLDATGAGDRVDARGTLDLIGHSSPDGWLVLGDWTLDPLGAAWLEQGSIPALLRRLGITTLRLLGCNTASEPACRNMIVALASSLQIEVCGTSNPVSSAHFDERGFCDTHSYLLVSASELRDATHPSPRSTPYARCLDLEALPSSARCDRRDPWPLRLASPEQARELVAHVRISEGATMPGCHAEPCCELALEGREPGTYRRIEVLSGWQFVRVYPDGPTLPGIVFAVADPGAFERVVAHLPAIGPAGTSYSAP